MKKVSLVGFELEFTKGVDIGPFFQALETGTKKEISSGSRSHLYFVNVVDFYICGLVLSYRASKKFLTTVHADNKHKVNKSELAPNEHGTEVSIFCIHPTTKQGLFYSCIGAASPTLLQKIFGSAHASVKRSIESDYKNEWTNFGSKAIARLNKKIRDKFPGEFKFTVKVTPNDLDSLLSQYGAINKVHLNAENALSEGGKFAPLDGISKKSSVNFSILDSIPIDVVKSTLKDTLKAFESQKDKIIRFYGATFTGEELNSIVGDNTEHYGSIDYDEYFDKLPTTFWEAYPESDASKFLLETMVEHFAVLGPPPKNCNWKLESANPPLFSASIPAAALVTESA